VLLDKTSTQESHTVLKETTAWLLTSAMEDVMTSASGTGGRAYFGSSMAQAGKSGTTTSNRDTLFAGFTPYYTCVVWGGYDDNAVQNGSTTTYSKNIWKAVMKQIHEGLAYKDFVTPSGITSAAVCRKSGKLAIEGVCDADPRGSMVTTEYFATDTVPTEYCDHHVAVNVCAASGMIAGSFCPADQITTAVYITGGTEGSTEYEMNATEEFLNTVCTVHTAGDVLDTTNPLLQNGSLTQMAPAASSGGNNSGGGGSSSSGTPSTGNSNSGTNGGTSSEGTTGGTGSGSEGTGSDTTTGSGSEGSGSGGAGTGGGGNGSTDTGEGNGSGEDSQNLTGEDSN
jgi:penicillin-binding protein 1A